MFDPLQSDWSGSGGRFFGAAAAKGSNITVDFWRDKKGVAYSSVFRALEETVNAPGKTYVPSIPAYVVCITGRGGSSVWMNTVHDLAKELGLVEKQLNVLSVLILGFPSECPRKMRLFDIPVSIQSDFGV
ncbi:MAG: hypothetical protein AB7E95_12130 [Kiritimatiellales bacterium]